jgi:hypothetical protein
MTYSPTNHFTPNPAAEFSLDSSGLAWFVMKLGNTARGPLAPRAGPEDESRPSSQRHNSA